MRHRWDFYQVTKMVILGWSWEIPSLFRLMVPVTTGMRPVKHMCFSSWEPWQQ
jgi:hypothetical protein